MIGRPFLLLLVCLGPIGWALFWAVFHTVPGQDWVVFHTAAAVVRAGDFHTLNDPAAFTDLLNRSHAPWLGQKLLFHPWVYPPVTLLLALAFGWLSYPASLLAFLSASMAALVASLWPWQATPLPRALLIGFVLLCPATAFTLGAGQMSFLVAACVLAGMAWLPQRPLLAGAAFGLLCLKPQFAPMIPFALLAGRQWRAAVGAALCVGTLVAASLLIAGVQPWLDWIRLAAGLNPARAGLVEAVRIYDQSVHTCAVILGAGPGWASAAQWLAMAFSALCVWRVFGLPESQRSRLIVLLCAMVFAAPHVGDYDHVLVAVACVLVLLDNPAPVAAWFAAAAWLATLFNPPALIAVLGVKALTLLSAATPLLVAGLMATRVPGRDSATSVAPRYA